MRSRHRSIGGSRILASLSSSLSTAVGREMPRYGDAIPRCPICVENLGKYGGPSTLPCGEQ